jgi:hypothetical protein
LAQVDEADRPLAGRILGDTLIQTGAFLGFVSTPRERMTDPEGQGLADDLIGDDPIPDDARRFDERGYPIPKPEPAQVPARPESDDDLAAELMDQEVLDPADLLNFDREGNLISGTRLPVRGIRPQVLSQRAPRTLPQFQRASRMGRYLRITLAKAKGPEPPCDERQAPAFDTQMSGRAAAWEQKMRAGSGQGSSPVASRAS